MDTAKIWNFFQPSGESDRDAICKFCKKKLSCGGKFGKGSGECF